MIIGIILGILIIAVIMAVVCYMDRKGVWIDEDDETVTVCLFGEVHEFDKE